MRELLLVALWMGGSGVSAHEADSTRWWERDMLDFSGEGATVLVNPLMDLRIGGGSNGTVFENNRGARFDAVIDGEWKVRGTLQERQGAADPLNSYWAAATADFEQGTVALPGWGRAKWLDRTEYEPGAPLRFDASRATTTLERSGERVAFRAGLDNVHEGNGFGSAFWSRNAAPLPFAGLSYSGTHWHAEGWAGSAIGSERGPTGATAESLFARQRVSRLGGGLHRGERWSTDVLWYRMARVPFGSESPDVRHWGGFQGSFAEGPFSGYVGLALDWAACLQSDEQPGWMGELVHLDWRMRPDSWMWLEWQRARAGAVRTLRFDGKTQLSLFHTGTPLTHLFGDGVASLAMGWSTNFSKHWSLRARAERVMSRPTTEGDVTRTTWTNPPVMNLNLSCQRILIPLWGVALTLDLQAIKWREANPDIHPSTWAVTHSIGLSHKFHMNHP